jgi:hypothetical protein
LDVRQPHTVHWKAAVAEPADVFAMLRTLIHGYDTHGGQAPLRFGIS